LFPDPVFPSSLLLLLLQQKFILVVGLPYILLSNPQSLPNSANKLPGSELIVRRVKLYPLSHTSIKKQI